MSTTRVPSRVKAAAVVAAQQAGSFGALWGTIELLTSQAPDVLNKVAESAMNNTIPGFGLAGRVFFNGIARAGTTLFTGAEWTGKNVAAILAVDVGAAYAVQALINGSNQDQSNNPTWAVALTAVCAVSAVSQATQWTLKHTPVARRLGLFGARATRENSNSFNQLSGGDEEAPTVVNDQTIKIQPTTLIKPEPTTLFKQAIDTNGLKVELLDGEELTPRGTQIRMKK
jgi:hypothetical protein